MKFKNRNSGVDDAAERFVPSPPPTLQANLQTVVVVVKPGELIERYCDQFFDYLEIAAGPIPLTKQEIHDYVCYLIEARVKHVNGKRSLPKSDFAVKIPSFVSYLLCQIGYVEQSSVQLRIVPSFERTENMILSKDDEIYQFVTRISNLIYIIAPKAVNRGFPSNMEGNADFMSMTLIDGIMKSCHANVEPAIAFASAFLEAKRLSDLMTAHVSYGSLDRYSNFIHDVSSVGIVRR